MPSNPPDSSDPSGSQEYPDRLETEDHFELCKLEEFAISSENTTIEHRPISFVGNNLLVGIKPSARLGSDADSMLAIHAILVPEASLGRVDSGVLMEHKFIVVLR
ncbi:hypothetical protein B0A49_04138 [Cryomyces minteri]|uniref:Uncharacterized protein n=1 Tax=Cryomyces minteri TaxID=331657 RepID=A0A4U0XK00_9PEZI|nr:hypothetical protein B0A49_04138 [Cryomyces minteri]